MKSIKPVRALAGIVILLFAAGASAQKISWADSYRLEAAAKFAEAQAAIEPLATKEPVNEFALMRSAWLLYLQGNYPESEKRYLKAAEFNPRSLDANLGVMLPQMAQYRWLDAMKAGGKVIRESAWQYTAHVRLMVCEEGMSRWADLAKHAAEVSARYPSDATVLVYWARAEAALHNTQKAKALYNQVLERFPIHAEASTFIKNNP